MTRRLLLGACMCFGLALAASATGSAAEGRWKLDDSGGCYFDAADEGPDQCQPGRWKDDGNGGCYFDANDSGPDQCSGGQETTAASSQDDSLQVAAFEAPVGRGHEYAARAEEHRKIAPDRRVARDNG